MMKIDERIVNVHPPFAPEGFSLTLPESLQRLRNRALHNQQTNEAAAFWPPTRPLIDADSWRSRPADEDWLIWRGRRCAERLRRLPLDLEEGELLAGRFQLGTPAEAERNAHQEAHVILAEIPPFPLSDAGHFHPDYETLFRLGLGGLIDSVINKRESACDTEKLVFYDACLISLEGFRDYIARVADACQALALAHPTGAHGRLAAICRNLTTAPPGTFHEAIELMFLLMNALWFGDDHPLTSPGRVDQTMLPYYEADLQAGRLTRREAYEILCCLYIQLNRMLHTSSAIAVMVGGSDQTGRTICNDLTYLALMAKAGTHLSYPNTAIAWRPDLPRPLLDLAARFLAAGLSDPAFFNDPLIQKGLQARGVAPADASHYVHSTCVEIKVAGQSNIWVTAPYINLAQHLLDALAEAANDRTAAPGNFEDFLGAIQEKLQCTIASEAVRLDATWKARAQRGCFPFASCFVHDCLARGLDLDRGGARYNWVENSFVGLANLVDGCLAIKRIVYQTGEMTLRALYRVLQNDFEGQEALRQKIINRFPHYGNNEPETDALARRWTEFLIETTGAQTVGLHPYVPGFFCWIMHDRLGAQTGATPDGRRAGWPLADGAGAAQGRERQGPTASILSTTAWSHEPVLGGLVHNVKFSDVFLADAAGREALLHLINAYMRQGGFEIQVNVVSRETLLDARSHPEQHGDLLVRVAGYSDYFVKLTPSIQEEVIARTEHGV